MAGRLGGRRKRRQNVTGFRLHKPKWVDPYPQVPGTVPEKMIFEALVKSHVFFIFQGQVPELEHGVYVTMAIPGYKPDFIIPQYKVIIDPFSEFHHTLPGAVARDIRKIGLYTALGYSYYHPWSEEVVRRGGYAILSEIPELHGRVKRELTPKQKALARFPGYELGPFVGAGANSVGAANRSRRKPRALSLGRSRRTRGFL